MNRRELLKKIGLVAFGSGTLLQLYAQLRDRAPNLLSPGMKRRGLVRPPGSLPEEEFLASCIRCQRCVEVCKPGAIRLLPGSSKHGGTPYLIPEETACNLCLRCGPVCPTGAIVPLEDKADAAMGVAVIDKDLCVSINGTGICGACYTACPLRGKAIKQGIRLAPTVIADECVGCGLCEEVCIVHRDKAIRVHTERSWS